MMPNETTNTPILTLDSDAKLETAQSISDLTWHEIQNAYRTRRILTGMLGGIEKTENGSLIAVVYYKDFRTVIPVTEMMIHLMQDEAHDYGELALRQNKILNNMLGCEIDFLIKGLDPKTRSIVASRKAVRQTRRSVYCRATCDLPGFGLMTVCFKWPVVSFNVPVLTEWSIRSSHSSFSRNMNSVLTIPEAGTVFTGMKIVSFERGLTFL